MNKYTDDYVTQMSNYINDDPKWMLLNNLYDNFSKNKNNTQKIPKIIHQIWLGGEFPDRYVELRDRMMKINSGWEYKLWTDKDIEPFKLKNSKLFNNIKNLGAKSDILRYEILERIGGVYIDIDFDCVKHFDDLLTLDFFAGNGHVGEPEVFNSIMASSPNYKYITALVNELLKKDRFDDNIDGVMNNTGPYFITRVFFDNINEDDNVVIFPTKYFFPYPAVHRFLVYNKSFIHSFTNDRTYCIHLWHTNWQK